MLVLSCGVTYIIVLYFRKEIALLESASAAASDVTNAMMSVKVELEEKKKTNELLQRALVGTVCGVVW